MIMNFVEGYKGFVKKSRIGFSEVVNLRFQKNSKIDIGMDKSWITKHRLSQDYINGVKGFLDFAFGNINAEMIKCPCPRCCLVKYKVRVEIEGDLICYGFLPSYTNWFLHGEELDFHEQPIISSRNRFQVTAKDENTKLNTNIHQSSSINSDQEVGFAKLLDKVGDEKALAE